MDFNKKYILGILAALTILVVVSGCITGQVTASDTGNGTDNSTGNADAEETNTVDYSKITTFTDTGKAVANENGKPVVYIFSTTWCPHCVWVKETVDSTVAEYVAEGKIVAYHWELDTGDNTLTAEVEEGVPAEHLEVYQEFNPRGSIPTYIFGEKYFRVGNGHERSEDLDAEEAEFRAVIEALIAEAE